MSAPVVAESRYSIAAAIRSGICTHRSSSNGFDERLLDEHAGEEIGDAGVLVQPTAEDLADLLRAVNDGQSPPTDPVERPKRMLGMRLVIRQSRRIRPLSMGLVPSNTQSQHRPRID